MVFPKRAVVPALALAALGAFTGLIAGEIFARLRLEPPMYDRIPLDGTVGSFNADCYPRSPDTAMPFDLERAPDAAEFSRELPFMVSRSLGSLAGDEGLEGFAAGLPADEAVNVLRERTPLCVTYDMRPGSTRYLPASPSSGGPATALLGDSFVFGQGVDADGAFPARLSRALGRRVVSYAQIGDDLPGIEAQFARAMSEHRRLRVDRIVYVYVLNDPYRSPDLDRRLAVINDLMNVRLSAGRFSPNPARRLLAALGRFSALFRAIEYRIATRMIADRTIAWYRDLNDPARNPGLLETFERLRWMAARARSEGVDFQVVVYPLMLDMRRYPLAGAHRKLIALAEKYGIVLHDLLPAFAARADLPRLTVHPLDYHPNGVAHGIAAEAVAAALGKR